jgi:hypothetical protein
MDSVADSMLRPIEPRPKTKLLKQPTPNLTLPIIDYVDKYRRKHQLRAAEANEMLVVGRLRLGAIASNGRFDTLEALSASKERLTSRAELTNSTAFSLRSVQDRSSSTTSSAPALDQSTSVTCKLREQTDSTSTLRSSNIQNRLQRAPTHSFRQRGSCAKVNQESLSIRPIDASGSAEQLPLPRISLACYVCEQSLPADQLLLHEQKCQQEVSHSLIYCVSFELCLL